MSRTFRNGFRSIKKLKTRSHSRGVKSEVDEFLEEYEKKNQNPFIKLRSI